MGKEAEQFSAAPRLSVCCGGHYLRRDLGRSTQAQHGRGRGCLRSLLL